MPKYKEIAIALKKKIVEGEFKEGELLPDQETLAKMYQTSRVTVRKAIQLLIDEGLLYTRRGSGTYVRTNNFTCDLFTLLKRSPKHAINLSNIFIVLFDIRSDIGP